MSLRHVVRRGSGVIVSSSARAMARGGGGPPQPPFARNKPADYQLNENHELVWDDGVAPETCVDFDAPHMSSAEALAWWSGGFAFFAAVFGLVTLSDPESKREAVPRSATLPATAYDPRDLFKAPAGEREGPRMGTKRGRRKETTRAKMKTRKRSSCSMSWRCRLQSLTIQGELQSSGLYEVSLFADVHSASPTPGVVGLRLYELRARKEALVQSPRGGNFFCTDQVITHGYTTGILYVNVVLSACGEHAAVSQDLDFL